MIVRAYTDGSCNNNTKMKGGFGIIFQEGLNGKPIQIAGGRFDKTTSNRMEMMAIIRTLEIVKERNPDDKNLQLIIHTDSAYCLNTIERKWARKWVDQPDFGGKKNEDLWRRCLNAIDGIGEHNLEMVKVKGHSGVHYNEIADKLASIGANKTNITIDDYE